MRHCLELAHLRCWLWALGSCRTRKGKGWIYESGLIPQMLSKNARLRDILMFVSKYIGPQRPQASATYNPGLFIYNLYGSATGGTGPIPSCFHSAGDRSPHSTA